MLITTYCRDFVKRYTVFLVLPPFQDLHFFSNWNVIFRNFECIIQLQIFQKPCPEEYVPFGDFIFFHWLTK